MCEGFLGGDPHSVVVRIPGALHLTDIAEWRARQDRVRWGDSRIRARTRYRLVEVAPQDEVGALGPIVTGHRGQASCELPLHVEIPRLQVGIVIPWIHGRRRETGRLVKQFLDALAQIGYDGPIQAEPFNAALRALPLDQACAATSTAMKKAFRLM